jgi:hypothetical protein
MIRSYPRPNAAWFGREPVEVTMASMFHNVRRTLAFFLLLLAAAPLHAQPQVAPINPDASAVNEQTLLQQFPRIEPGFPTG